MKFWGSPGEPGGRRDLRDFVQQLNRGDTAAYNDDLLPSERRRTSVILCMYLPSPETPAAGNDRNIRRVPGASGVDNAARREVSPVSLDPQPGVTFGYPLSFYRMLYL